jgi:NADH-quinone oxidoreductase subunit N
MCLAAAAFSLVSLPPTVGFIGKLWLITSLWNHGYNWLVIVVCVNSAIAIFYYLSLVRHAYTEDVKNTNGQDISRTDTGPLSYAGALVMGLLVLILGVVPGPIYSLVLDAAKAILGGS